MEKEVSEDSYCTTDEGDMSIINIYLDKEQKEDEDEIFEFTEKIGDIVKITKEAVKKEIISIGDSKTKPSDIDSLVFEYKLFLEKDLVDSSEGKIEIDLGENFFPEGFNKCIVTMRKNETSRFHIRAKYGFKNMKENLKIPIGFNSPEKIELLKTSNLVYEVTLYDWYIVQSLMDNQEITKKIISNGSKWQYPKLSDFVNYSLSMYQNNKMIYERKNIIEEIDRANYFEIEKRIIQNTKYGELAEINVKSVYMKDKNSEMIKHYNLDITQNVIFKCHIHDIEQYEYIYNVTKDKFSKKHIMKNGFGNDSPDRECLVKLKLQIWNEDRILFDNFKQDINKYIDIISISNEFEKFREELIKKNNLEEVDLSENLIQMEQVFNSIKFDNLLECDLRNYSIPIILRKVLVHMKRNEIVKVVTQNFDYFFADGIEIYKLPGKFTIYCQLYEFLARPLFSKYNWEQKLEELVSLKEFANKLFKDNKFYRASKIYHNINYRFNYGDVFGSNIDEKERKLKESNPELLKKLLEVRNSCHLNFANCKLKMEKYYTSFETSSKILKDFDCHNQKALLINAKTAIILKKYEIALEDYENLVKLAPNNSDFTEGLLEVKLLINQENNKKKNMYKKMFLNDN